MKKLGIALILFLTVPIGLIVHQYFFCPRFSFEEPQPFRGRNLYNPYQDIDSTAWAMCNFHAHSSAWGGLTNGHGTPQDIWNTYDSLGYAIHLVSNYQKIDHSQEHQPNFIPAYEHGFNIGKVHHLVLGDQVQWMDYLLPQILSNKQWILNQLTQDKDNLIIVNHPDMKNGIEYEDVKYLSNYRCMEVLSPYSNAVPKWDSALSVGKPIFLIGSDDVHNVFENESVGRFCTVVNTPTLDKDHVLNSLRKGSSYGMKLPLIPKEDYTQKVKRFKTQLPKVISYKLDNKLIRLKIDKVATEIIFTGKNGKVLAKTNQTTTAKYVIKDSDEYVRTTVIYSDGTMMYLNPIFRYESEPFVSSIPTINTNKSIFFNIIGILVLLVWGFVIYHLLIKRYWKSSGWRIPARFADPQQG